MEKDTDLYLIGKVSSQYEYDETKLFILPLDKRAMKSLRLARFLAWLIRLLMFIENIPLWTKKQKPPYPPAFYLESVKFSFWGKWITGENLPNDDSDDDEAAEKLLGGNDFAIFTRSELKAKYPSLLSCESDDHYTSVSVTPDGYVYFRGFTMDADHEAFASAHISDILTGKTTPPPADQFSHRRNPGRCAKCGGTCQYDDQGNLAKPLGSNELHCLDCAATYIPGDWLSPACPKCGSQNHEG